MVFLAECYAKGHGVEQDLGEFERWCRAAVARGKVDPRGDAGAAELLRKNGYSLGPAEAAPA